MMASNEHIRGAAERLLAALKTESVLSDDLDLLEIETLPISDVRDQLVKLQLPTSVPAQLQRAIAETSSPAAAFLKILDDDDQSPLELIENMPIAEVNEHLHRLGLDCSARIAQIDALDRPHVSIVPSAERIEELSPANETAGLSSSVAPARKVELGPLHKFVEYRSIVTLTMIGWWSVVIVSALWQHSTALEVLGSFACGALLAWRSKVLALVTAMSIMLPLTLVASAIAGAGLRQIIFSGIGSLIALQLGYLLGVAVFFYRYKTSPAKDSGKEPFWRFAAPSRHRR